jgi:hypothetical protein
MMTTSAEETVHPSLPPAAPVLEKQLKSRQAKRLRARARVDAAVERRPTLRTDRLPPIHAILRIYREHPGDGSPDPSPLVPLIEELRVEVEALEGWADRRGKRAHHEGATIRQALGFLRTFGRMMALDFSEIPIEERPLLVSLLAMEHRWCYAAAGTTREAFKVAIGRTGAR